MDILFHFSSSVSVSHCQFLSSPTKDHWTCISTFLLSFSCSVSIFFLFRLRRVSEEGVPDSLIQKYVTKVLDHVMYNVDDNQTLVHFEPVKANTHCIFSKTSVLWGARDWNPKLSLEANVERSVWTTCTYQYACWLEEGIFHTLKSFLLNVLPYLTYGCSNFSRFLPRIAVSFILRKLCLHRSIPALIKFLILGPSLHLDGFLFELPGDEFGYDIDQFGQGVRRVLTCISDHDPAGHHCMNKSYVSLKGWSFEFDNVPIFVTTFAPCYPENHSRYAFGAENGFILLQPMYSFAIHDIGPDTPHTNWDNPTTIRDKIRTA